MEKFRINYSFIKPDGSVLPNQHTGWSYDRDFSNKLWLEMKAQSCFANLVPEKVDEDAVEKHRITVAFRTYDYVIDGPIKIGDKVKVISGGKPVELKVLEVDPPKKPGINYVYAERA